MFGWLFGSKRRRLEKVAATIPSSVTISPGAEFALVKWDCPSASAFLPRELAASPLQGLRNRYRYPDVMSLATINVTGEASRRCGIRSMYIFVDKPLSGSEFDIKDHAEGKEKVEAWWAQAQKHLCNLTPGVK